MLQSDSLFLGLDASTQSLKAVVIDSALNVVHERAVNFDLDLPEFRTCGGVHVGADGLTVTAPAIMWVAALDILLERMKAAGCPFSRIVALSGSGQQHGSVWLGKGARQVMAGLHSSRTLREQLAGVFSLADSPIWMDSSTTAQCREREARLGGAQAVADATGSRAYERFTGNQIAKVAAARPDVYAGTEHIALVSSFMTSILIGDYAPIDWSDASGMNLMDIRAKCWHGPSVECTAAGLAGRLPGLAAAHTVAGRLHGSYVERYGFDAQCQVILFSGDNPNSLAGLRLQKPGDIAISLGTSDTVFGSLVNPRPSGVEGHVFGNPVEPDGYMAMICYKNGSLTREAVRNRLKGGSWDSFNGAVKAIRPGNYGQIGFYFEVPEITPPVMKTGIYRFDSEDQPVESFPTGCDARAIIEGQCLSMRLHGGRMGMMPRSILATGGASQNKMILKTMADIFGVDVHVGEQPDSAALGAAYRAVHGWRCSEAGGFVPFAEIMAAAPSFTVAARPDTTLAGLYARMLERYEKLERKVATV